MSSIVRTTRKDGVSSSEWTSRTIRSESPDIDDVGGFGASSPVPFGPATFAPWTALQEWVPAGRAEAAVAPEISVTGTTSLAVANDPYISLSWHLKAIRLDALKGEFTGLGVSTGIFDESVQASHADLAGRYDASKELVVNGVKLAGTIGSANHGTAVAGVIAANAANGQGSVGISWDAKITGIDIFGNAGGSNFLAAMNHMRNFDTTNNSWGWTAKFTDNLQSSFGSAFHAGLKSAADTGRGGLGTIILNAAGNEWGEKRDANASEFNQSRYTITVGAIGQDNDVASYANRGASILVSGTSNGGGNGIVTTDVMGAGGYVAGDYVYFGGTSAATPVVTGVVNLMMEASAKSLGWRDVQDILAITADHTSGNLAGGVSGRMAFGWTINKADTVDGGGMHFSNDVGFGRVDAFEATRFAEIWKNFGPAETSANEAKATVSGTLGRAILDNQTTSFTVTVAQQIEMEHVDLTLTLSHGNLNQLRVELVSPEGTRSIVLSPMPTGTFSASGWTWTFGSEALRGELSAGTWTVRVTDTVTGSTGSIASYRLDVYGDLPSADDVYHYTNEFFEMAALSSTRRTLNDTDGGNDWINIAGAQSNVVASLMAGGATTLGGVAMFNIAAGALIENIVTGDGNDTLTGNDAANKILGMRGNDTIFAGLGNDTLVGGAGADLLDGGLGLDTADYMDSNAAVVLDFALATQRGGHAEGDRLVGIERAVGSRWNDVIRGSAANETLIGGAGHDTIASGGGNDWLQGDDGNDLVTGDAGLDTIYGGLGNDVVDGGTGQDFLSGEDGNDLLRGGGDDDSLSGGNGDDSIAGGLGNDLLWGDAGADRFVFDTALGAANVDTVYGFVRGVDKIALDDAIFGAFRAGIAISTGQWRVGTAALDADDRLIYDSLSGRLFYDQDGIGGAAQMQFATMNGTPALSTADFLIM